jgi:asparagine synthase (glutamine-hydrolysing)
MCGLFGYFSTDPLIDQGVLNAKLKAAQRALHRRGPDDCGLETFITHRGNNLPEATLALGHTRLSIIDISSAGHQPMKSADGRYAMVFNGEIYNYKELCGELKAQGYQFTSASDTEVLLAAWAAWGSSCLSRLAGMFAFAVLDRQDATLTCVRDAFGIKPFFYAEADEEFVFASEAPALIALRSDPPDLNWRSAYDYLVHGDYDSSEATFFDGVLQLRPGHLLVVDLVNRLPASPKRWWVPVTRERYDLSFAEAAEQLRGLFLQSVRLHLRSDVPVGAALSGGVDSSAVICAMRHIEQDLPIHTFSYIASGSAVSEEVWVDRINRHVGATPHKMDVSADELANGLDDMIRAQGEPFGSTSIYAQYRVFHLARQAGVTVMLDGQGADEMMAGYNGYPGQRLRSLIETGRLAEAVSFLDEWSKWPGRSRIDGAKRLAAEMTGGWLYELLRTMNGSNALPSWINGQPLVERGVIGHFPRRRPTQTEAGRRVVAELASSLTQRGLPALLRHGDRNSMRFSVESRVPFLTLDIVNLLLSLPESYLISAKGETKHIFRAAMRGIVPDDVLDRRDKIGFATPEQAWLISMADRVRGWLREDLRLPFFNQAEVLREFELIVAGKKAFSWQVWRWINFCRWYSHFIA